MNVKIMSTSSETIVNFVLLVVCLMQGLVILYLMGSQKRTMICPSTHSSDKYAVNPIYADRRHLLGTPKYSGVAVTLFLGSPGWFQNRYSMMVNNINGMIPDDWVIQIFYKDNKMALKGIFIF